MEQHLQVTLYISNGVSAVNITNLLLRVNVAPDSILAIAIDTGTGTGTVTGTGSGSHDGSHSHRDSSSVDD